MSYPLTNSIPSNPIPANSIPANSSQANSTKKKNNTYLSTSPLNFSSFTFNFTQSVQSLLAAAANVRKILPLYKRMDQLAEEINLLTSYSSDTVYRLSYDSMTYDYISPAIIRLLGFTPQEMKKINFRSLILETRMVSNGMKNISSFEELEKSRKQGNVSRWQADYLIRSKDGRKIWVTDISFPWFNEKGIIIGSVGSLRDISVRVSAEAKVQEEMLRLVHTDPLTGIANRNTFFTAINSELKRFKRSRRHFAMLLIDIDHFKKVNDDFGYDAGDRILVEISRVMESCLRETDLVARLDGEEFGIFLPDTPEEGAYWVAERICREVSKHCFFVDNSVIPVHSTVSIGVSSTKDKASPTVADIYKQADTRLYIAKHTGRNQVSMDEIIHTH